ncbi:hypothetical protein G6F50_013836 [Rhizopus delemar]|uniref:Uncharacterized protein n=1 Tax=Rhizopus delemar TaxID=936053 RepID=A0A9P7CBL4_9FUNG|nr:hypothetical protein G6F50_013836 [Rhizopus delemar]
MKVACSLGVQAGQRLVQQEHLGLDGKRAGDRHALLLPARQLRRVAGGLVGQADDIQAGPHARGDLFTGAPAMHPQREGDVFKHGLVLQQVELLEDHAQVVGAEAVAAGAAHGLQRLPGHLDAALAGQQHPGQQSQQRALAATTDAAQQHAAALLDPQLRNVQHQAQPIAELHLIQPDQRSAAHGASRGIPPAAASPARAMPLDWHSGTAGWR